MTGSPSAAAITSTQPRLDTEHHYPRGCWRKHKSISTRAYSSRRLHQYSSSLSLALSHTRTQMQAYSSQVLTLSSNEVIGALVTLQEKKNMLMNMPSLSLYLRLLMT